MKINKKSNKRQKLLRGGALNEMHFPQDFSKTVPHLPPTSEYYYPLSGDLSYPNHLIENSSTIPVPLKGGKRVRKNKRKTHRNKSRKTYKNKSRKTHRNKSRKTHKNKSRKTHRKNKRKTHRNKSRKNQRGGFITDFLPRDVVDLGRGAVSGAQSLYSGFVGKTMPYSAYPNVMNQPYLEKYPELNITPANVNEIYNKSDNLAANV